jgi:aldehyde dehydrogenase (NAD+)/phenylacetaldehyde dehydrogenase
MTDTDYKMWIGGQWCDSQAQECFESINPATGEVAGKVPRGQAADVGRAIVAARRAFDDGEWPRMSYRDRGEILRQIAQLIREKARELAELETIDNGKPIKETTLIDIPTAADTFESFAGMAGELKGETIPVEAPVFCHTCYEPIGVIAQIIPWNYPLLMAAWKLAPALLTGNAVVLKPSSLTSLTALKLARLIEQTDMPPGVVNVVTGTGSEAGRALASHPEIDKIALTGSTETGREVMGLGAATIKKTTLELGGKSPTIVFKDADLETAVRGTMATIFLNQGQMCVAGSRLLVEDDIHDEFLEALVEKTGRIRLGNGLEPETAMGPLISAAHRERVQGFIAAGLKEGARLVAGGKVPEGKSFEKGFFLEPTIFDGVEKAMEIAREEIFGPVLSVLTFATLDEAVALANASRYGLAASIWTNDIYQAHECASRIRAGTIWINTYGNFFSEVPFGGYRQSGLGRELGKAGLREYTELKSITMDTSPDRRSLITKWYGL